MSFASLLRHALITAVGVATAVMIPLVATTAVAPAASAASARATSSIATSVAPQSAAYKKAVAAKAATKQRIAAKKAAKKRAIARSHARSIARGKKIVAIAAKYKGRPYRWAAAGPLAFDCSGFTLYVARKALGVSLPHYTVSQSNSKHVKRVKNSDRHVGDLVFYHQGGTIGHVGIYAGNGMMWDSPHSGSFVGKRKLHSGRLTYGRIV